MKVLLPLSLTCALMLLSAGCNSMPPAPGSAFAIGRLPASTTIIGARGLSDNDIPSLGRLHQLREVHFSIGQKLERADITDQGLERLAGLKGLPLEILDLGYCGNITDAGMVHVAKMNSLTWLSLRACPQITDAALPPLLSMPNLTGLDLRGCPGITDKGLELLAQKPGWRTIMLGGCPNVPQQAVDKLQGALPTADVRKDEQEWRWHQ